MPSRSPLGPLSDIKENIELARAFVTGLSFAEFQADKRTVYAVTRCLNSITDTELANGNSRAADLAFS